MLRPPFARYTHQGLSRFETGVEGSGVGSVASVYTEPRVRRFVFAISTVTPDPSVSVPFTVRPGVAGCAASKTSLSVTVTLPFSVP